VRQTDIEGGEALMSSYRRISRGIEAGLALLGVEASMDGQRRDDRAPGKSLPTICFAKAARCDLVSAGRKVVGSAQTRTRGCVLQHGSVPLTIDLDELLAVLPDRRAEDLDERRSKVSRAAVGVAGFERCLGVRFREADLLPEERACAESLVVAKYGTAAWTERALQRSSGPSG
jgi:lipoate-protein ligase A